MNVGIKNRQNVIDLALEHLVGISVQADVRGFVDVDGVEIARGLARCGAGDAAAVAGKTRRDLPPELAECAVVIHADELVVGGHD